MYLTTKQAAKRLKIKPRTVQLWARQGKLKSIKIGTRLRIAEQSIKELLHEE